jgi:hypothetical protein
MPHLQTPSRRSGPPCSQPSRSGLATVSQPLCWRAGRPRPLLRASALEASGRGGKMAPPGPNKKIGPQEFSEVLSREP